MSSENLKRDQNFVTVLGGVTDDTDQDVTMLRVDPITKRLLVAATGGGGGTVAMETATPTANPLVWTVVNNPVMIIADNQPFYNGVGVDVTGSGPYTLTFSNAPTTVACLHS